MRRNVAQNIPLDSARSKFLSKWHRFFFSVLTWKFLSFQEVFSVLKNATVKYFPVFEMIHWSSFMKFRNFIAKYVMKCSTYYEFRPKLNINTFVKNIGSLFSLVFGKMVNFFQYLNWENFSVSENKTNGVQALIQLRETERDKNGEIY